MHILHYITGLPGLYWYNIHIAAHYTCQYIYVYARTKKHTHIYIYIYIYTTTHVFSSKHRWERETWSHLQQAIQLNLPQHPQIRCTKCHDANQRLVSFDSFVGTLSWHTGELKSQFSSGLGDTNAHKTQWNMDIWWIFDILDMRQGRTVLLQK